jgi:hypothetical protein
MGSFAPVSRNGYPHWCQHSSDLHHIWTYFTCLTDSYYKIESTISRTTMLSTSRLLAHDSEKQAHERTSFYVRLGNQFYFLIGRTYFCVSRLCVKNPVTAIEHNFCWLLVALCCFLKLEWSRVVLYLSPGSRHRNR